MKGYKATVVASNRELTTREKIKFKDFTDMTRLDEVVTEDQALLIDVDLYVTVQVHNEKNDPPDYDKYVIVDKNGTCYVTSSESLLTSISDIEDELKDERDENFTIKIFKRPSKNYKGKFFLACSLA